MCTVQLCEYVFPLSFPLHVPKNGVFASFEGEDVKIVCSNPKRHYPAWICVCWCIACRNRFNHLWARSVKRSCVQSNKEKNWVLTLAIWADVIPGGDLDQMWHVGRYGGRNHLCNIWQLSVKGCRCSERDNCPLPLTWGVALTTLVTLLCDHVIIRHAHYSWVLSLLCFLSERLCRRKSVHHLSVTCNVVARYSESWTFPQYFSTTLRLGQFVKILQIRKGSTCDRER